MKELLDACREPPLKDILSDAIVKAMMEADRVDPSELEAMLTRVARNLRSRPSALKAQQNGCI